MHRLQLLALCATSQRQTRWFCASSSATHTQYTQLRARPARRHSWPNATKQRRRNLSARSVSKRVIYLVFFFASSELDTARCACWLRAGCAQSKVALSRTRCASSVCGMKTRRSNEYVYIYFQPRRRSTTRRQETGLKIKEKSKAHTIILSYVNVRWYPVERAYFARSSFPGSLYSECDDVAHCIQSTLCMCTATAQSDQE